MRGVATLLLVPLAWHSPAVLAADPTPTEVFERRLLPTFKSPNPSSCVQCHLAGVDLKDYILPDAEKTFRLLRASQTGGICSASTLMPEVDSPKHGRRQSRKPTPSGADVRQ